MLEETANIVQQEKILKMKTLNELKVISPEKTTRHVE